MDKYRSKLIAEFDLFCAGLPLNRGRRRSGPGMHQPLENQQEMLSLLEMFDPLMIAKPCIVDVECGYMSWTNRSRVIRYDVDNVLKAILDNLQRVFILADDKFVVGSSIVKLPAKENYTLIKIYESEVCYRLGNINPKQLKKP
jgi:Holliday junction resolvase RusA-like endonuclease